MGKKRDIIPELFVLRAIACLTIVLLHSLTSSRNFLELNGSGDATIIRVIQLLLMYGTPIFVIISEILISNAYKDDVPKGFFTKRIKFILIPFILMGVFYAWFNLWRSGVDLSLSVFLNEVFENVVLGRYHGYFILIIFQFYILHFLFQKYIYKKFSAKLVILASLGINIIYLAGFNVLTLPSTFPQFLIEFASSEYKMLFFGWIFYFTIGFYTGRNFDLVKSIINSNIIKLASLAVFSAAIMIFNYFVLSFTLLNSQRFDVIVYTISVFCILFWVSSKLKKVPNLLMLINNYSFGIYLLHMFFIGLFSKYEIFLKIDPILNIFMVFLLSLALSIFTVYILNKLPFGYLVAGRVNSVKR